METIKENRQFRRAYRKGVKGVAPFVVVYCLKTKSESKYGITVSKKIGKAVVRNRIKRLIRESLKAYTDSLTETFDIVIVARSAASDATLSQIEKSLGYALVQTGAISV